MARQILSPDTVHKPTTYYSHAIVVGKVVYLAGQAPHDISGAVWDPSDPGGQIRHVFENMARVLDAAGASFTDIVRMTVLLRQAEQFPLVWDVAKAYLGSHQPAMTAAVVDGLAGQDYLLEIDAIAVK
jgi:enamine deaminase RidA (YjgF/YER057c/UK114 family)